MTSRRYARHTHRFGNKLIRYDKENNKCIVRQVLQDSGALFDDITGTVPEDLVKGFCAEVEETTYFKELDNVTYGNNR